MSKKTAAQLVAEINGACRDTITAAINGNIPSDWTAYGLMCVPMPGPEVTRIVIHCAASPNTLHPRPHPGARLEIDIEEADLLRIADMLAERLRESIGKWLARHRIETGRIRVALAPGAVLPERKTAGASGYDLCALGDARIPHGRVIAVDTGVTLEMPEGMEAQVRPRSGLTRAGMMAVLGTVDSDYRSSVRVLLANLSTDDCQVVAGDRIAQLVFARVDRPVLEVADMADLTQTERGAGGFGSTGR